ncbi:MAG: o-succinylbenzoate synthase [Bacteroidota bacterium]|nr:o-succinylbenzoate synthase [Bacteroidota bacterium]
MNAECFPYQLQFKFAAGTSRGVLHEKETWFISVWKEDDPTVKGWGECAVFRGLSYDDRPEYADMMRKVCEDPDRYVSESATLLAEWPSIRFGLETACADMYQGGHKILHPSRFTQGEDAISINGLVWMGRKDEMLHRIHQKLNNQFRCIKLKIGAIDFKSELSLLKAIRNEFSPDDVEIRVDANGAFLPDEALEKLKWLSDYQLHSIEQPIRQGQPLAMNELCSLSPIPVALDEELINHQLPEAKKELLKNIRPQYIIIKPALVGGFSGATEWIRAASDLNIGWWITSALESNIGLNAIAQWTYTLNNPLPQGLGTGQLYLNNIPSPLVVRQGALYYLPDRAWQEIKL